MREMYERKLESLSLGPRSGANFLSVRIRYGADPDAVYECGVRVRQNMEETEFVQRLRWVADRIEAKARLEECPDCSRPEMKCKGSYMKCEACGKRFGGTADGMDE
jgi:hypothetical protein